MNITRIERFHCFFPLYLLFIRISIQLILSSKRLTKKTKKNTKIMAKVAGIDTQGFHAVEPKRDCPHCTAENIAPKEAFEHVHVNDPCADCGHLGENWVCLQPDKINVRCSRYVNSHMLAWGRENEDSPIVFSFADFSFWCYKCDSYVVHPLLNHTEAFYLQKFAEDEPLKDVLKKMKDTKHEEVLAEADEEEDSDEEEKKEEEKKSEERTDGAAAQS